MWIPIQSKYAKKTDKQKDDEKKKRESYQEQVANIDKQLTQTIVSMINDNVDDQATVLLRDCLKKLKIAQRFLR